jgi:hypothetical protein
MVAFAKRHLPWMSHHRCLTLEGNEFGEAGERALLKKLEEKDHCVLTS